MSEDSLSFLSSSQNKNVYVAMIFKLPRVSTSKDGYIVAGKFIGTSILQWPGCCWSGLRFTGLQKQMRG